MTEMSCTSRMLVGMMALAGLSARAGAAEQTDAPAQASVAAGAEEPDSATRAHALDRVYGYKGWNIPFPSLGDSLTQDDGHWRTKLASHGFGVNTQNSLISQANVLDRPSRIPKDGYPACAPANLDYNCAGGHSYFGQGGPEVYISGLVFLTYDMSQWGVPDGQIAAGVHYGYSTDQQFSPDALRIQSFSWYQTMLDKKLELKIGYFPSLPEFTGTFVGGMVASPFGPSSSIPIIMGQSPNGMGTPNFRLSWNLTPKLYTSVGIQRSMPVHGPTGNPLYDEEHANPSGLDFKSSVPGTRVLYTNEWGYKTKMGSPSPSLWLRAGMFYNTSNFRDYSRLMEDAEATKKDVRGFYLLGDYQVYQPEPSSPYTSYRGLYLGASFMQAPEEIAAFYRYFEARAYWLAPFPTRNMDMVSLIYTHSDTSKYVKNVLDSASQFTNLYPIDAVNSVTFSYMYNVRPGLYLTAGAGYTDNPSLQYFKGEGNSLNLLFSIYALL